MSLLNARLQLTSHTLLLHIQSKRGVKDDKENIHIQHYPDDPVKPIHEVIRDRYTLRIDSGQQIIG
jgi:hypothetical protein